MRFLIQRLSFSSSLGAGQDVRSCRGDGGGGGAAGRRGGFGELFLYCTSLCFSICSLPAFSIIAVSAVEQDRSKRGLPHSGPYSLSNPLQLCAPTALISVPGPVRSSNREVSNPGPGGPVRSMFNRYSEMNMNYCRVWKQVSLVQLKSGLDQEWKGTTGHPGPL